MICKSTLLVGLLIYPLLHGLPAKVSVLFDHYEQEVDRESDYKKLIHQSAEEQRTKTVTPVRPGRSVELESESVKLFGAMAKSAANTIGSQIGRQIIRRGCSVRASAGKNGSSCSQVTGGSGRVP